MTVGYEQDLPHDMPEDAYPSLSVAKIYEFLRLRAEEKPAPEDPAEHGEKPDSPEDPHLPAA
jgi:hypothetical protein